MIAGFDRREFDAEGRWVEVRYDTAKRKFSVISAATARREHIYLEQRFSDHAPVVIDYGFKL